MNKRIIETTQFWNESFFFKERVRNCLGYADLMIIAESEDSFSQKISRPLMVPALIKALDPHEQKRVICVPVDLKPLKQLDHMGREAHVRQAGFEYLKNSGLLRKNDIVLVQDFDEFFDARRKQVLIDYFRLPWRSYIHPRYRCTYYYLNCLITHPDDHRNWALQLAFRASFGLRTKNFSIHAIRTEQIEKMSKEYWGWHHSYLGNIDFIKDKISAFAHADDDMIKRANVENFQALISSRTDIFGRDMKFEMVQNYREIGIPELFDRTDLMG